MLSLLKSAKEEKTSTEEESVSEDSADKFKKVLVTTIVRWACESFIESPVLIREMFRCGHGWSEGYTVIVLIRVLVSNDCHVGIVDCVLCRIKCSGVVL